MSTLAEIVANVSADLSDVGNLTWSAAELERAIRWALHQLSWASPRRCAASITATPGTYEYSLSAVPITDLMYVIEVWHPYDPAAPPRTPPSVAWSRVTDDLLLVDCDVIAGQSIRIFYAATHTISGLDSAALTTLDREREELVCLGAAGHAAQQRALESVGLINVTSQAPLLWQRWGEQRLAAFAERLAALARRRADPPVPWISWAQEEEP